MDLKWLINLERVNILEEAKDFYRVQYNGQEYRIMKSDRTYFANGSATDPSVSQEIRLEQILLPEAAIIQDEKVPQEFKEVMMFHEIRESEYKNAGLQDAHERALNDEVLYALKFFTPKQRKAYVEFAKEYRDKQLEVPVVRLDEEVTHELVDLFYKSGKNSIGNSTGVELGTFNGVARDELERVKDRLVAKFKLWPSSQIGRSTSELGAIIEYRIKPLVEQGIAVIIVDNDPARLECLSKMQGVVTINGNRQDIEKMMYETYKRLMKEQ